MYHVNNVVKLFEQEIEPPQREFDFAIQHLRAFPQDLLLLEKALQTHETEVGESRNQRFAKLLQRLTSASATVISSSQRAKIASNVPPLLLSTLPYIVSVIDVSSVINMLRFALELCISTRTYSLSMLAAALPSEGDLLEHLCADQFTGPLLRQWVVSKGLFPATEDILELWTTKVSELVEQCSPSQHGLGETVEDWQHLLAVKQKLRKIEGDKDAERMKAASSALEHVKQPKMPMTTLNPDSKKTRATIRREEYHSFELEDPEMTSILGKLGLDTPTSSSGLQNTLQDLAVDKTNEILLMLLTSFPCKACGSSDNFRPFRSSSTHPSFKGVNVINDSFSRPKALSKQIGSWRVVFSTEFRKNMDAVNDSDQRARILAVLRKLSEFKAEHKLAGTEAQRAKLRVPLARSKCTTDTYVLWQIDVGFSELTKTYQQQIKIWNIAKLSELEKTIDQVTLLQTLYTETQVERCRSRNGACGNGPVHFDNSNHFLRDSLPSNRGLDIRQLDDETVDLALKFYMLTKPVAQAMERNDRSAEYPLELTREQVDYVRKTGSSSLALGRSGTGKTTCLVEKLVNRHQASMLPNEGPLRQVFLTTSNELARKLSVHTHSRIRTETWEERGELHDDDAAAKDQDRDDNDDWSSQNLESLHRESFPLVGTLDQFYDILENTVRFLDRQNFDHLPVIGHLLDSPKPVINHVAFKLDYWSHFPALHRKGFDPNLIFAEIQGLIKGSASPENGFAPLSRAEYLNVSVKQAPLFTQEETRSQVYDIFDLYEERKAKRKERDVVDRAVAIHLALRDKEGSLKKEFVDTLSEIYVDEVQDMRVLDIRLLLSLIRDATAFHLAGDTAQTISQDSTFRFQDVKTLMFDQFLEASSSESRVPMMFFLNQNYRSHQGILSLASFIMHLLVTGYPRTVDKLEPESSIFRGPRPTMFVGCDSKLLLQTSVGLADLNQRTAEFGAEQVILVRDEAARKELQSQIEDAALILTIKQSKGMEFDDVILWNFFSQSPHQRSVRHLGRLLNPEKASSYAEEHREICSELKNFYVAVTRARIQFFMLESSQRSLAPIISLLVEGDDPLVELSGPNFPNYTEKIRMLHPAKFVDPKKWSSRGWQLMQASLFKLSLLCFEKADDEEGKALARAEISVEEGRASTDAKDAQQRFEEALAIFLSRNKTKKAAELLERMERPGEAARLWVVLKSYNRAAQLYDSAAMFGEAAQLYAELQDYPKALASLRQGGQYGKLVTFIVKNRDRIDPVVLQRSVNFVKMLLKQNALSAGCRSHAISLIGSSKEEESYYINYDMNEDLVDFYKKHDQPLKLFHVYIRMENFVAALEVAWDSRLWRLVDSNVQKGHIGDLVDLVMTGILASKLTGKCVNKPLKEFSTGPGVLVSRLEQWWRVLDTDVKSDSMASLYQSIESDKLRSRLALCVLLYGDPCEGCSTFDEIPFFIFLNGIEILKSMVLENDQSTSALVVSVSGLWINPLKPKARPTMLSWSRLPKVLVRPSQEDAERLVRDKLSNDILKLVGRHGLARSIWRKWPETCQHFLANGFCSSQRNCQRAHTPISSATFKASLQDFITVTNVICEMRGLFNRHVLPQNFQRQYLGNRRLWLEGLIQKITYVSGHQQDHAVLLEEDVLAAISPAVSSSLEDLLFYRLGREWSQRKTFSSILEQIQLARSLGFEVENRFGRSLRHRISFEPNASAVMFDIQITRRLEEAAQNGNPESFLKLLRELKIVFDKYGPFEFTSYAGLMSFMEAIAAFCIASASVSHFILPKSWIRAKDIWLRDSKVPETNLFSDKEDIRKTYKTCLEEITRCFCILLSKFDLPAYYEIKFWHYDQVKQRNAELLAVVTQSLMTQPESSQWNYFKSGLSTRYGRARDFWNISSLQPKDLPELLANSFSRYNKKDCLIILRRMKVQVERFKLSKDVEIVDFEDLWVRNSDQQAKYVSDSSQHDDLEGRYTEGQISSVSKLQSRWRTILPKLRKGRAFVKTRTGQFFAKWVQMARQNGLFNKAWAEIILAGPELEIGLEVGWIELVEMRRQLDKYLGTSAINTEGYEDTVDTLLSEISGLKGKLETAESANSEENLANLVIEGNEAATKATMEHVQDMLCDVEEGLTNLRRSVVKLTAKSVKA